MSYILSADIKKTTQHRNSTSPQGSKGISMRAVPVLQNKAEKQLDEKEVAQEKTIQTKRIFQFENVSGNETQLKQNTPFQLQTTASTNKIEAQQTKPFQLKPNNTGMPDNLKVGVENLSGMDMSDVKVHYNSSQPAQLSALAYAQGNDIHIGPGQEKHLPHEAWHVVQQRQGRVQATKQMKMGVAINDDASLESEADVMGEKALQIQANTSSENISDTYKSSQLQSIGATKNTLQRKNVSLANKNYSPIQLYRATMDGLESTNGKMEVKNNGNLWATSAGLIEANSKNSFLFEGEGTVHDRALVTVRPGNVAVGAGNQQVGEEEERPDMQRWKEKALSEVVKRVNDYVDNEVELVEEDEDKMAFVKKSIGIEDEETFQMEFYKRCSAWRQMLLDNAVIRINQYASDPTHTDSSRLLLVTDCGVMAGMVSRTQIDLSNTHADNYRVAHAGGGDETIAEWPHHVAAPIMTDGGDYVTMETAASKVTDFFSKPAKDKAWGFKMYGALQGETFKDKFDPLMSGGREFDSETGDFVDSSD